MIKEFIVANFKVWSHNVSGGKSTLYYTIEQVLRLGMRIETEAFSSRSET
jgi:hypothetical protein